MALALTMFPNFEVGLALPGQTCPTAVRKGFVCLLRVLGVSEVLGCGSGCVKSVSWRGTELSSEQHSASRAWLAAVRINPPASRKARRRREVEVFGAFSMAVMPWGALAMLCVLEWHRQC